MSLMLEPGARQELWRRVAEIVEDYAAGVDARPVAPPFGRVEELRGLLEPMDFAVPMDPRAALDWVAQNMPRYQLHVANRRYFGLFNPAPTTISIAADTLVAALNPQLAAWGHAPFGVEVEQHLLRVFARKFGYDAATADGTFTSCGSEANHTALLAALVHAFPDFVARGLRGLPAQPVLYTSSEGHHSMHKAVRVCGLGLDALRVLPVDDELRMDVTALRDRIACDRRAGLLPFLVVATAGTTNAGIVEPLEAIADVAAAERLWLHVDAAWGGAAALAPELRPLLAGIERSDSITFDAHKWLSVPVAAGMFLTRHPQILDRTFRVSAAYVPRDPAGETIVNPLAHSLAWSHRFTGLKVFLSLAVAGWEGYSAAVRHMTAMGGLLRQELRAAGWEIVNHTPLPVICFRDPGCRESDEAGYLEAVMRAVVGSGQAWISSSRVGRGIPVLRACITNYGTEPEDIRTLVASLDTARSDLAGHVGGATTS